MQNDFHPSTFAPPLVWARLILANRGVPKPYWGKLARILIATAMATPLRLAEWLLYSRQIANTKIEQDPLFILGFGRSGTTHLQNLLAQDPTYGYLTTFQMVMPTFSLVGRGWLKRRMEKDMGEQTRRMDNVKVTLDTPQEEDVALANLSDMSFVHQLSFPQQSRRLLEKYVLMGADPDGERLTASELRRWERTYLRVLRKMTLHADGRQLLLRNTINIGRVDHLSRLFPDAKFIHIIRNPYDVYPSLMKLYRTMLPLYQLDDYKWPEVEEFLVEIYPRLMQKYLADRALIPAGHLAEVRFEDLERDPLGELARLYAELDLPDWENAEPQIAAYLETIAGYRKNAFRIDPAIIERVDEKWRFAVEEWNYRPPSGDSQRAAHRRSARSQRNFHLSARA